MAVTVQPTENTSPRTVPAIHSAVAADKADSSHAAPPANSSTVDATNSARYLFAAHTFRIAVTTAGLPPLTHLYRRVIEGLAISSVAKVLSTAGSLSAVTTITQPRPAWRGPPAQAETGASGSASAGGTT